MTWDADPFANPQPGRRYQFPLVRFNDIELTDMPRCIVEDLIPRESLVVVWGPPKCGKSFCVFDLVMHVALGRQYRGKQVEQGTVVYIAAEGELGVKARAAAFRKARMAKTGEDPPFYLLTTRLDLVQDIEELIADIKAQLPEEQCLIIVIDTLNRTIHGSESKDDDMGAYRDAADRMRVEFRCAVIIIHHCGINGDRPRGHTSLTGAVDAQLAVKRDVDKSILVTLELMKDGPEGDMMRLGLEVVDVGIDRHGKLLTSCVIEHLDTFANSGRHDRPRKLPPTQARALALLHEAIIAAGEIPPTAGNRIPAGKACVREELWREYCYQGGGLAAPSKTTGDPKEDARRAANALRMAFGRAYETLIAEGHVGAFQGWVWIP
jgi:AAA domain